MHNKFIVVDKKAVWFGTTNISHTGIGAEYNANTSLIVRSKEIARVYSDEFAQMFEEHLTSIEKKPRASREPFHFKDGTEVEIWFSPQDSPVANAVIPFIQKTNHTLDVAMFFLTDHRIVDELKKAASRGVKVRIIYDAVAAWQAHSKVKELRAGGIEVKVENLGGKMHMKTAVSDGTHTLLGSMNWSHAGDKQNDENTMVIRNNAKLASQVLEYFDDIWEGIPVIFDDKGNIVDPFAESWQSINACSDGIDNNHNQLRDEEDYGCR